MMFKFVAALFLALVGAAAARLSAPDELAAGEPGGPVVKKNCFVTSTQGNTRHVRAI